ncbi:hypothetical protein ZBT109_2295 [Zymobacter palmae]|uniref:Transporter n=2 Tax=Zymobacter palmae TaxID=33074 RepID=A0A348HHC5_9GAMM|nr:hypothetical protein ZBT109_2295 [Zymobacter palmae]
MRAFMQSTRNRLRKAASAPSALWSMALLAAGLSSSFEAQAAAWVQPQGKGEVIVQYLQWSSHTTYNRHSSREAYGDNGKSSLKQLNPYVEYGLTPDVTLIGNFYLKQASYSNDADYGHRSTTAFGDQEMGIRYNLPPTFAGLDAPWVGAAQWLLVLPFYSRHKDGSQPDVGMGGIGNEFRYSIGRPISLFDRPGYIDLGTALRLRTGGPADEWRVDIASGLYLTPKWLMIGEINQITGLRNGHDNGDNPSLDPYNYNQTKLRLSFVRQISDSTRLQLGYEYYAAGRNTGAGGAPFVGFWWHF